MLEGVDYEPGPETGATFGENALAKAAITRRGIDTDAIPLILDEKRSVIRQTGALTYSHPESADHLGGYAHLRGLLHEAAATFSPAARAWSLASCGV